MRWPARARVSTRGFVPTPPWIVARVQMWEAFVYGFSPKWSLRWQQPPPEPMHAQPIHPPNDDWKIIPQSYGEGRVETEAGDALEEGEAGREEQHAAALAEVGHGTQ